MPFESVRFHSFRNLVDGELDTRAPRVFLVGDNGQGKTNFLEALYYLSYGSSFRGSLDAGVSRRGSDEFGIFGMASPGLNEGIPSEEVSIVWKGKTKEIRREGKPLRDRRELISLNPSVVFCHDDFSFSAGEPERRRFFFDQTASLVSASYLDVLREYKKVLRQRNALLREGREDILPLLDEQLAGRGLELQAARRELAGSFGPVFSRCFEDVSLLGIELALRYRPSWEDGSDIGSIVERLSGKRKEEFALKTSLSGPHRDRWSFVAEGRDFAASASTGQLRLISLVLRIAQANHYSSVSGKLPILLLDDVLLELDPAKRKRLISALPSSSQSFFTFLPGEPWEDYLEEGDLVYRVADGRFSH